MSLPSSSPVTALLRRVEHDYQLRSSRLDAKAADHCSIKCHQVVVEGGFEIVNQDESIQSYLTDMMPVSVLASKSNSQ